MSQANCDHITAGATPVFSYAAATPPSDRAATPAKPEGNRRRRPAVPPTRPSRAAKPAKPKTSKARPPASAPVADPAFSILALGKHLAAMTQEALLLDLLITRLGHEVPQAPLDAKRLAQRHARHAQQATEGHIEALETLLLRSRATCLGDAVVQVMLAGAEVDRIETSDPSADQERRLKMVQAALESALRVMAPAAGVPLADIGGRSYGSTTWCDRWPMVDLMQAGWSISSATYAGVSADTVPAMPARYPAPQMFSRQSAR